MMDAFVWSFIFGFSLMVFKISEIYGTQFQETASHKVNFR